MADHIYLDGSQPYHRHHAHPHIDAGSADSCGMQPVPVHVFDTDALTAHDNAVRQTAEVGEGEPPTITLDPDRGLEGHPVWEWVMVEPSQVGQDATTARVLAGYDHQGIFHRYVPVERLVALFRAHVERDGGTQ